MAEPDWYAVLGVGRTASRAQIARAFRRLAFRWHPDRNASHPELAHRQFLLVHQAYEVLYDPATRRAFDAERFAPELAAPSTSGPPARRNPKAPPPPRPPVERPQSARTLLSRAAWLPLALMIRLISFFLMLFLGPLAERLARNELDRKAPALVDYLFPIGRIVLVAGIVLLVVQRSWRPFASPAFAIALIVAGVIVFVIERIMLASIWAFGRGGRPKS